MPAIANRFYRIKQYEAYTGLLAELLNL